MEKIQSCGAIIRADNLSICLSDEQISALSDCILNSINNEVADKLITKNRLSEKCLLTIPEAAEYSNIGQNKITELLRNPRCEFVIWVGKKKLVKRKEFEDFLSKTTEI